MEGHARLDNSLIDGVNQELSLLIVESDAEPEACRDVEVGVALHDQILGHHVGIFDGLADSQTVDEGIKAILGNQVSLLLLSSRVDKKSTARHGRHLTELATHVDIDSLGTELVVTAVHFKFVDLEAVA